MAGEHWIAEQERYNRMTVEFDERIVAAVDPGPGGRVPDVGIGSGTLSLAIGPVVIAGG